MRAELSTRLEVQNKNLKKRVLCYLEYTKQERRSMFLSRGGLFLAPLSLLNYFLSNLFLFCKKVGGREELKPPPQPLPLRGPAREGILVPNKALVIVF